MPKLIDMIKLDRLGPGGENPMSMAANAIKIANMSGNDLRQAGSNMAGKAIEELNISQGKKDALNMLKDSVVGALPGSNKSLIGSVMSAFKKPTTQSAADKPENESAAGKVPLPTFGGISAWDSIKNFGGNLARNAGLNTHEISDKDYVYFNGRADFTNDGTLLNDWAASSDPRKGQMMNKKPGWYYSKQMADYNDITAGKKPGFSVDAGKLIKTGIDVAKMLAK